MLSLSQACSTKAKLDVPFDGGSLEVWHNPSVFTSEFEVNLREDAKANQASVFLVNTLSKLIISWDLVDDEGVILGADHKGEVVPTDALTLAKVPVSILIKVSNVISASHGSEDGDTKKDESAPILSGSF